MNKVRSKESKGYSGRKQVISNKKKKVFSVFARDFSTEIRNSSGFSGRYRVFSEKERSSPNLQGIFSGRNRKFKRFFRQKADDLQNKGLLQICKGFFGRNREFKRFLRPKTDALQKKKKQKKKNGLHPKNIMKSGVSPLDTPIWASICTPVAPSLLISPAHSSRLGGHKQSFDTVQILSEGAEARNQGFAKKMGGLELKVKVVCVWQRAWGETFSSWAF